MIREYRLKNNLTQEQLAEKLDISSRHLQRLEYEEDKTTVFNSTTSSLNQQTIKTDYEKYLREKYE